jgi:NADH dehydrogenase
MVTKIDAGGVTVGDGDHIAAATVLWGPASGLSRSPVSLGVPLDRAGRVLVQPDLSVAEYPEIQVVGDIAALAGKDGRPLPGVAPVAQQQGRRAAANILARIAGEPTTEFRYRDRGNMATIGRNHAIAEIGPIKLTGFIAWSAWLFVHVQNLIGFRNRLIVMTQWLWSYLTYQRGARLITKTAHTDIDIA